MACTFPKSATSVDGWLDALNLARYKPVFAAASLQVEHLPTLSDSQLQAAGVAVVGHRKRMLQAVKELVSAPPPQQQQEIPNVSDVDMMDVENPGNSGWPQKGSSVGSVGRSELPSPGTTAPPVEMDVTANANAHAQMALAQPTPPPAPPPATHQTPQQKANSTSSIYITSTLVKPDTDEVVFCIAAVVHDRIQQGEGCSSEDRHRFPFFSEDNNPLYAPPPERDGRGSDQDSGSDSSQKRTRREIPTEDMIFHTIRSVYECARIPAECLIVSLVYIERLIAVSCCPMLVTSWRPILLSSLILAQKVWDDRSLHNIDFSVFCPMFTLKEINFLEKKFLELIDYDVSISASLYASYYFQLRTLCQRVDREMALKPMDLEAAAKLEARGVAYKDKFKSEHGVVRKHQSDNNIGVVPGQQSSNFLSKLFG